MWSMCSLRWVSRQLQRKASYRASNKIQYRSKIPIIVVTATNETKPVICLLRITRIVFFMNAFGWIRKMNDRLVYGMEPRSAHFCWVNPKVDQATGSVSFQDLDQLTGSAILQANKSCVLCNLCMSVSTCHKAKKLLDSPWCLTDLFSPFESYSPYKQTSLN